MRAAGEGRGGERSAITVHNTVAACCSTSRQESGSIHRGLQDSNGRTAAAKLVHQIVELLPTAAQICYPGIQYSLSYCSSPRTFSAPCSQKPAFIDLWLKLINMLPGSVSSLGIDLVHAFTQPFLNIGGELSGALLYLDAGAGEAVHLNLGLESLISGSPPLSTDTMWW